STWSETQPAGNVDRDWYSATISDDGQVMLVGAINARLQIEEVPGQKPSQLEIIIAIGLEYR
ncbi:hypothetical protein KAZ66_02130, partial [Candidatus Woesebacteria bacterium]|nr:hypothetical protein [Candidatus Woesebacteria bacterium]